MNATPPTPGSPPCGKRFSPILVAVGILLTACWTVAHIAWGMMAFMANLMANDSGSASPDRHLLLIGGMIAGQVLAGLAGIPAGLAVFWHGRRKILLLGFLWLFLLAIVLQVVVFASFFTAPR